MLVGLSSDFDAADRFAEIAVTIMKRSVNWNVNHAIGSIWDE